MDRVPDIHPQWRRVSRNLDDTFRMEFANGIMEASYTQRTEALPLEPGAIAPRYVHHAYKTLHSAASVITDSAAFPYDMLIEGDDVVFFDHQGYQRRVVVANPHADREDVAQEGVAGEDGAENNPGMGGVVNNGAAGAGPAHSRARGADLDGPPAAEPGLLTQAAPSFNAPPAPPAPRTPRSRSPDEVYNLIALAAISPSPSLHVEEAALLEYAHDEIQRRRERDADDQEEEDLKKSFHELRIKTSQLLASIHASDSSSGNAAASQASSGAAVDHAPASHPEFVPGGMLAGEPMCTDAPPNTPATLEDSLPRPVFWPQNVIEVFSDSESGPSGSAQPPRGQKRSAGMDGTDRLGKRKAVGDDGAVRKYHPAGKPCLSPNTKKNAHALPPLRPKAGKKNKSKRADGCA